MAQHPRQKRVDGSDRRLGAPCAVLFARPVGQSKPRAQLFGQHCGGQGDIPAGWPQRGSSAGQQAVGNAARGNADRNRIRGDHLLDITGEGRPILRQSRLRDAEKSREPAKFAVIAIALGRRQRRRDDFIGGDAAVRQGRKDPAQRRHVIGAIAAAGREPSHRRVEEAGDCGVPAVKPAGGGVGLGGRAEHHRVDDSKGAVKTGDRVGQRRRMVGDRRRDPGMRQLKQQSATGGEKQRSFAMDPPHHRSRAKRPRHRISEGADRGELAVEIGCGDGACLARRLNLPGQRPLASRRCRARWRLRAAAHAVQRRMAAATSCGLSSSAKWPAPGIVTISLRPATALAKRSA